MFFLKHGVVVVVVVVVNLHFDSVSTNYVKKVYDRKLAKFGNNCLHL